MSWYTSVKTVIFVVLTFSGCYDGTQYRTLCQVTKGSGLDFIGLWNLKGYTCDANTDGDRRSALIDGSYSTDSCLGGFCLTCKARGRLAAYCGMLANFKVTDCLRRSSPVKPEMYTLEFPPKSIRQHSTNNVSLFSWLIQAPTHSTYDTINKYTTIRTDQNPKFMLHPVGDLNSFFIAVWHTSSMYSPRIFYSQTGAAIPVSSLVSHINDNVAPVDFGELNMIRIIGKYIDSCASILVEPGGTIHKTMEECYALLSCPPTQLEINNPHVQEALYHESGSHADHLPGVDIVWSISAESLMKCGSSCRSDSRCLSFFYDGSSAQCHGYKRPISWTSSPKNSTGMKHYINQNCKV